MDRNLSDVHYDMINLGSEIEGLKAMLYTISMSVENLALNESTEEKLDRLAAPYPAIISSLDTIIRKLDGYTDELDAINLHMRKVIDLPCTALKAEMLQGECDEVTEGRCKA